MPNDPETNAALARTMNVNAEEWQRIVASLGRSPTFAELGVFSVMWSEHCSYKSSRIHLRRLPTTGPKVVQGPGENAGAVDIGDGYCAVFKMESHNHPSYIEPYQGAATGVGGILRDVFTMGARPVASLNSLRFGRPEHPKTRSLLRGVVAGIGGYGNSIGVPTVGGELQFDASYDGNILVNAFTVGVAAIDGLFFGKAEGLGNSIIYVGARTGRDGIHGATMASAEFDADSEKKLPTVQVGDPFMEKLLLEACLEIFRANILEGVQDMGAAGLTSSSVEMAARAGNGIQLDLDAIPRRTQKLTPYEMLLSESQERMLMVAKPGCEQRVIDICVKWGLDVAVVGRVTDTGRFVCTATPGFDPATMSERPAGAAPVVVTNIPIGVLTDDAPKYDRPQQAAPPSTATPTLVAAQSLDRELLDLLASPNIGSRAWVWRQYDHIVRGGSATRPGQSDAAIVRVVCSREASGANGIEKYLALSVDCNGRYVQLDPYTGAAMAVAECARNIVCSGGEPLGLTDCLNFGSPEKPETMWRFSRAIDGIRDACNALGVPVVSGNVSLYNETDGKPIIPTPGVAIVGQLQSIEDRLGIAFREAGDTIALVGRDARGELAGSEWLVQRAGLVGTLSELDLELEAALQKTILQLARARVLSSAHDVSDGGLAVALAECSISGGVGCDVRVSSDGPGALFSEEPSRVIVSYKAEHSEIVTNACAASGIKHHVLGGTGGSSIRITTPAAVVTVAVDEARAAHSRALDGVT